TYYRLDVHALALAVLAYDGSLPEDTPAGGGGGGDNPVGPQDNRPFRYTIDLGPEARRTDADFRDPDVPPAACDAARITPGPPGAPGRRGGGGVPHAGRPGRRRGRRPDTPAGRGDGLSGRAHPARRTGGHRPDLPDPRARAGDHGRRGLPADRERGRGPVRR